MNVINGQSSDSTEYKHKEAFCLMRYECDKCKHQEIIWNSRDGVTPFGTACPSCDGPLMHAYFASDTRSVNHRLLKFQKFWRDGTKKEAKLILARRCIDFRKQGYDMGGVDDKTFINKASSEGHEFQKGWPVLDICLNPVLQSKR